FSIWAIRRCLEAAMGPGERRKIVVCIGRIVDLATNCYGHHVLQKVFDCEEGIVSELLRGHLATTLVNKYASLVWTLWTPPAPGIPAWYAALACLETRSLVVQHAFENLEESAKDEIVDELLGQSAAVLAKIPILIIDTILEHRLVNHHQMALQHLLTGLLEFATKEQGSKSVVKARSKKERAIALILT
ncbi:hypothetical protein B0H14DRAFT_2360440, partial [Mycena olivaceomarginata]